MKESIIKSVSIKFNDSPPEKVEVSSTNNTETQRMKFIAQVTVSEEDRLKLRKLFMLHNRGRSIAIGKMLKDPNTSLENLKAFVFSRLTRDKITHTLKALVSNECYYIRKNILLGKTDIDIQTGSVSFNEFEVSNNRFVINARRDKILIEDLNVLLHTSDKIPKNIGDARFFLNICVADMDKFEGFHLNIDYPLKLSTLN